MSAQANDEAGVYEIRFVPLLPLSHETPPADLSSNPRRRLGLRHHPADRPSLPGRLSRLAPQLHPRQPTKPHKATPSLPPIPSPAVSLGKGRT